MNTERDKFLTEAMGECWHDIIRTDIPRHTCTRCGEGHDALFDFNPYNNFSTWEGFGKLWEWAQKQEWWIPRAIWAGYTAYPSHGRFNIGEKFINPDTFADAIYAYLKRRYK